MIRIGNYNPKGKTKKYLKYKMKLSLKKLRNL